MVPNPLVLKLIKLISLKCLGQICNWREKERERERERERWKEENMRVTNDKERKVNT